MTHKSLTLKRKHAKKKQDIDMCIEYLSQKTRTFKSLKSDYSKRTLLDTSSRCIKKDAKYYDAFVRIEQLSTSDTVMCHRKCNSDSIHSKYNGNENVTNFF